MKKTYLLSLLTCLLTLLSAHAAPTGDPAIVFHSDAYNVVGDSNKFSFLIGTSETATYTVVDALGEREVELTNAQLTDGEFTGNWYSFSAPANGLIKIYGDPSKIDFILANGAYITKVDMPECKNLWFLDLEHNSLQELDLTDFTKLEAIYLTDNTFCEATPLKIGTPKPALSILEIDIVDWLDQSFNLSDYPAMQAFDGYHNMSLYNVDPSGCPELLVLSLEMAPVSKLDISKNQKLLRLNISETRITEIDLTKNPGLEHFLASHDSGTINTDCYLHNVDISKNPNLLILGLQGNRLTSLDISNNPKLTHISLNNNRLTSLDVSAQQNISSLYVRFNDMDYATLPWPDESYYEYFYRQNPMSVPRSIKVGEVLDLSNRVIRAGTTTTAQVWRQVYNGEDELLDPTKYTYADGKIYFNQAMADSVYVEFTNDIFTDYKATTRPFRVKTAAEYGQPTNIVSFSSGSGQVTMHVGMLGATATEPKTFYVDFGDGVKKEFNSSSALDCSSNLTKASGNNYGSGIKIYIPEGEVMTALSLAGVKLSELDITRATELEVLDISGCGLQDVNLAYNRCLKQLNLDDNSLFALDLAGIYTDYEKNVLTHLSAANNQISSLNVVATYAMQEMNLSNNSLESINLENFDNLKTLNLSGNLLSEINLNHLLAGTNVDLSNNRLTFVNPCESYLVQGVNVANNLLDFNSLPAPSTLGEGYVYAPQAQLSIPDQASSVNLSEYAATVEGNATSFTWKKADGTPLTAGKDYRMSGTITEFLDPALGEVYCELSNAAFPQLSGANALRTSNVKVVESPVNVIASFTTLAQNGKNPEIILIASEPLQIYIDWTGEGSDLYPYPLKTTYKSFPIESITPNAKVTIYADHAADAAKITVLSIYNVKLDDVDLSRLTGAISINLGNTRLTPEQISMPDAPEMNDMNFEGNCFENFPYGEKYPKLSMLNLSNNSLTEFDCASVPSVGYLILSKNKLTSLSFSNPKLWSLFADSNSLEEIDLTGAPNMEQLLLQYNNLASIDLTPVKDGLRALNISNNKFTFATLPLQADCPILFSYEYGSQADVQATCSDGRVDLSALAEVNGVSTEYNWFVGKPTYDSDEGAYVGDLLTADTDYTLTDGVTQFLAQPTGKVCCLMTNEEFPSLALFTTLIDVTLSSIDNLYGDPNGLGSSAADIYNLQGIRVNPDRLTPGIYIVNGKKIQVK